MDVRSDRTVGFGSGMTGPGSQSDVLSILCTCARKTNFLLAFIRKGNCILTYWALLQED